MMNVDEHQPAGSASAGKRRRVVAENDSGQNVDNEDTTRKRHRVSRACDICRSRKDRCDGVRPVCSTCAALCRPCAYNSNPRKRGLPTGYLRTLEMLWGIVFSRVKGSEDVVRRLLKTVNFASCAEDIKREGEGSNVFMSAWKSSSVLKEVEKLLSIVEHPGNDIGTTNHIAAGGNPRDGGQEYDGCIPQSLEWRISEGTGWSNQNLAQSTLSAQHSHQANTNPSPVVQRQTRDYGTQSDLEKSRANERYGHGTCTLTAGSDKLELRLPSNVAQLFDIYFSYTHCWLPILEKHDILRTAFGYNQQTLLVNSQDRGSGDHAAVWAILTLAAIQQTSRTSQLDRSALSNSQLDVDTFYNTARRLVPTEDSHYEIGHVEALLLLTVLNIGQQKLYSAWMLIGFAIRIALALRLDGPSAADQSKATRGNDCRGRPRNVFLGCFVLETLIAAKMGRSPSLKKEDVSSVTQLEEDGLEEWHPWEDKSGLLQESAPRDLFRQGPLCAISTFNRLVSLTSILNEFCCCIQQNALILTKFEELERQLQTWLSTLPETHLVKLHENASKSVAPHFLGLNLAYESIATTIQLRGQLVLCDQLPMEKETSVSPEESSKRLLQLVQVYQDNYSISAMSPTFPIFLGLVDWKPSDGTAVPSFLYSEIRLKLQVMSSQLSSVWKLGSSSSDADVFTNRAPSSSAALPPVEGEYNSQRVADPSRGTGHHSSLGSQALQYRVTGSTSQYATASGSSLSIPGVEAITDADTSSPPTLQVHGQPQTVVDQSTEPPEQVFNGVRQPMPSTNTPSSSFQPRYPQSYNNSNANMSAFANAGENGLSRWSGVPPELDVLFDELASLEGTDKTETQPVFMRNLGFAPNSGVSDLFSYSSNFEPFLLSQPQHLVQKPNRLGEEYRGDIN